MYRSICRVSCLYTVAALAGGCGGDDGGQGDGTTAAETSGTTGTAGTSSMMSAADTTGTGSASTTTATATATTATTGATGSTGEVTTSSGTTAGTDSGGSDSTGTGDESTGGMLDPCAPRCGVMEVCDDGVVGLDQDCDGVVDPACACTPGVSRGCFRGDPSFVASPGCILGSQTCEAAGTWGPCVGGLQATEQCFANNGTCSPISTNPFVSVDLATGVGVFGNDAITETWTVSCPGAVAPCPSPMANTFTPLVSGEYLVTYEKTTAAGNDSCVYPLTVGQTGLRVELSWEWNAGLGNSTVDLDLHLHEPATVTPWGGLSGSPADCAWDTCSASQYTFGMGVEWFNGVAPPDPVAWYLDPVFENNTCYLAPKGVGQQWQAIGMGCHNPRLDVDNIVCDPNETDPQAFDFCASENINIDYPPPDEWTRIAAVYYSAQSQSYDVHPRVRVYCDGILAADLGPEGYDAPVTWTPSNGGDAHWSVADVRYTTDTCGNVGCEVVPLYEDAVLRTPVMRSALVAAVDFGPPYPP